MHKDTGRVTLRRTINRSALGSQREDLLITAQSGPIRRGRLRSDDGARESTDQVCTGESGLGMPGLAQGRPC
jgi:hypothetical protein